MEFGDYRLHLSADHARLRQVAGATDLSASVPSCPDWILDDLVQHVAMVYLHKVACMRLGKAPEPWPPEFTGETTLDLLDRAFAELSAEFDARDPAESSFTWFPPEQNVAFWHRRMALETAVHRYDAELAAATATDLTTTPVATDLALDGIDEFVVIMLGWGETTYGQGELIAAPTVEIRSAGRSWFIAQTPEAVVVETGDGRDPDGGAATVVSGEPSDVLLWLWRRVGVEHGVTVTGDPHGLAALVDLARKAGG